jgi:hypothetical protein
MVVSGLRCISCSTHDTPLWRAGPTGAKTLCNACGVKWKKGKLSLVIDGVSYSYGDVVPGANRTRLASRGIERAPSTGAVAPKRASSDRGQVPPETFGEEASAPNSNLLSVAPSRSPNSNSLSGRAHAIAGTGSRRSVGGAVPRDRHTSRSRSQTRISTRGASLALPRSASWAQFGDCSWALSGISKPGRARRRKGASSGNVSVGVGQLQRSASAVSLAPLPEFESLPSRSGKLNHRHQQVYGGPLSTEWNSFPAELHQLPDYAQSISGDSLESAPEDDMSISNRSVARREDQSVAASALFLHSEDLWPMERTPITASWPLAGNVYPGMDRRQQNVDVDSDVTSLTRESPVAAAAATAEYSNWDPFSGLDTTLTRIDLGPTSDAVSAVFSEPARTSHREDGLMNASEEAFMVAAVHGFCVQENDHSLGTDASNLMTNMSGDSTSDATLKAAATGIRSATPEVKRSSTANAWVSPSTVSTTMGPACCEPAQLFSRPKQAEWSLCNPQKVPQSNCPRYPGPSDSTLSENTRWQADYHGNKVGSSRDDRLALNSQKQTDCAAEKEDKSNGASALSVSQGKSGNPGERAVLTDLFELSPTAREIHIATQLLASIPPLPVAREMAHTNGVMALVRNANHPFSKLYAVAVYRLAALIARFPPDAENSIAEEAYIRAFVADQASCSICSAQTATAVHGRLDMQRAHSLALQGFYYDPHAYRRAVAAFRNMYAVNELNSFAIDEFFCVFMYDTRVALAKQRSLCPSSTIRSCHRPASSTSPMHQEHSVATNHSESSSSSALRSKA